MPPKEVKTKKNLYDINSNSTLYNFAKKTKNKKRQTKQEEYSNTPDSQISYYKHTSVIKVNIIRLV
jgi:uncharacterized membrane protein YgaE (UPF0421/DUF939 family)